MPGCVVDVKRDLEGRVERIARTIGDRELKDLLLPGWHRHDARLTMSQRRRRAPGQRDGRVDDRGRRAGGGHRRPRLVDRHVRRVEMSRHEDVRERDGSEGSAPSAPWRRSCTPRPAKERTGTECGRTVASKPVQGKRCRVGARILPLAAPAEDQRRRRRSHHRNVKMLAVRLSESGRFGGGDL